MKKLVNRARLIKSYMLELQKPFFQTSVIPVRVDDKSGKTYYNFNPKK